MLVGEALEYGFKLRRREYRKALLSRPCIYGVFSGRLGGFHPIKERCTGCMRCVQEYPGICTVERNPEFFKFADSYWAARDPNSASYSPVATVSYEAATGKIPVKGMGFKGGFAEQGWDTIWTDMSEIVRPTRDGVYGREYISTLVDLGRKPKFIELINDQPRQISRTFQVSVPIVFDYLPQNLNSPSILNSVARASSQIGTLFIASPEQAQRLTSNASYSMIPLVSSSDLDGHSRLIQKAPLVELAPHHSNLLEKVRELNASAPISIRLPLNKNSDGEAVKLAKDGVDIIHLFASYHGDGLEEDPAFVKDLIRSVHRALVKESLRDEVTLIASGGITLAEHVPKAIICGADLVALDTTILVALQAQLEGECKSPEQGRIRQERFDEDWGEQRLVNLMASWHDQLIEILSAMGMRDVRRLRGDVGRAMFNEDMERDAFGEIFTRA